MEQIAVEAMGNYHKVLEGCLPNVRREDLPIETRIINAITQLTGVTKEEMTMPDKTKGARKDFRVKSRQWAMYFIKENSQYSLKAIGKLFGDRDHATVIHSIDEVDNRKEVDKVYRKEFEEIEEKVKEIL